MIGTRTLAVLRAVCEPKTIERVIEPHVADTQAEWLEAVASGDRLRALVVRASGVIVLARLVTALAADAVLESTRGGASVVIAALCAIGAGLGLIAQATPGHSSLQLVWLAIAAAGYALGASVSPRAWLAGRWLWAAIAVGLLGSVAIWGTDDAGARRWLDIGLLVQPGELALPMIVLALVSLGTRARAGFVLGVVALSCAEPDPMLAITISVVAAAAVRTRVALVALAIAAVAAIGASWPTPLAHVLAGDLRLATTAVVALCAMIALLGRRLRVVEDPTARSLLRGITALFAVRLLLHGLGAVGISEATSLPFVSYGGSSLVGSAICLGLALRAARAARSGSGSLAESDPASPARSVRDSRCSARTR